MRYILNLKINKTLGFFALLLLNAKAVREVSANQDNISKIEMPTIDDPCNVNGTTYVYCQDATKALPSQEFTDCMGKKGDYTQRQGPTCCPTPDPTKKFVDCEPTTLPTDKKSLYIAATVGPFATILSCLSIFCCWKNRKQLTRFVTLNLFHEYQAQQQINATTPLITEAQSNNSDLQKASLV